MPADRIRLSVHFDTGTISVLKHTYIEFSTNSVDRQDRVPPNADYAPPPDGYTLVDAGFGWEFDVGVHTMTFDLALRNVFDLPYRDYLSRYRYYTDDPGFNAVLRIQMPFGSEAAL
jgi:iron complex outermembrane receptor protein